MHIRPALSSDMPVLLELLEMLFALESDFTFDEEKSHRGLEMMLLDDNVRLVIVAEIEGQVVGMCTGQLLTSTAMGSVSLWVEDVILKPQFRGQGLMPLLLNELEKWALGRGATRIQVLCDTNNTPALVFYPKVGFEKTHLMLFQKFLYDVDEG